MQHVYDAIKKAREVGEAWVTWNGERLRLVPPDIDKWLGQGYFEAIVKRARRVPGGLRIEALNAYKDGETRPRSHFTGRQLGWSDICAVIVERHPLKEGAP